MVVAHSVTIQDTISAIPLYSGVQKALPKTGGFDENGENDELLCSNQVKQGLSCSDP